MSPVASRKRLWTPSPDRIAASQMHRFMTELAARRGFPPDWESFRAWSIRHAPAFWSDLLQFAQIEPSTPAEAPCTGSGMLGTRWFPGMRLNYARHMLRHTGQDAAIMFENEPGQQRTISRDQLRDEVARCAAALRNAGVRTGDRVAAVLPNMPETIIAMLAAASVGATWSSCSPDFGARGVLDRFGQIEPKVLFVPDRYIYGGKTFDLRERAIEILAGLLTVERVVVVPYSGDAIDPGWSSVRDAKTSQPAVTWRTFLGDVSTPATPLRFKEVTFGHPLFIMYSSGTTSVPKCIVHGHGGTLLQHAKEHLLHCDLRPGERFFYFTTCGWMMWNWLASGLGCAATLVLFEGNPAQPNIDRLWQLAARARINVFGASPKFLAACQKANLEPGKKHDLSGLRCLLSTGSPLSEELFEYVYSALHSNVQLASISGGTDIISCFMLGNPILPVYAGEIQCRGLAMDVQAWDAQRRPLIGEKGELVCASPFPSQPVGFWNDPDGRKYRSAYFEYYTDGQPVWRHGDFIEITSAGGVVVYGRSDATLNPGGVRIGTAEIYRLVESIPEVADSLVVGRDTSDQDVEICLFVVLREGLSLTRELEQRIGRVIAEGATRRHVPRQIRQVPAIPYTVSGKKVELAVQQILHGQPVKNRDALANPAALDAFVGILPRA